MALANVMAEKGAIPRSAADRIASVEVFSDEDFSALRDITRNTRHVIAGFVRYMREKLGDAGDYFHLGATTQDIIETGLALQIRQSLSLIETECIALKRLFVRTARTHRDTLMVGRSQGQQGLPITYGFKHALWAWELDTHLERLREMKKRVLLVSMSGAMGTQASYTLLLGKENARALPQELADRLGLYAPPMDSHHRTDRYAELCFWLALVCSSLGEIGLEIRDLQRNEVAEVKEKWRDGMEGSSTMLHKQNPEPCHWLEGLAKIVRGNASAMMDIQMQHERDATGQR